MNKKILKIAFIGILAGFCISAGDVSANQNQEIAMSRCTKSNGGQKKCREACPERKDCKKCKSPCSKENRYRSERPSYETTDGQEELRNNYSTEKQIPKDGEIAAKRKSAAQKVLEGY